MSTYICIHVYIYIHIHMHNIALNSKLSQKSQRNPNWRPAEQPALISAYPTPTAPRSEIDPPPAPCYVHIHHGLSQQANTASN